MFVGDEQPDAGEAPLDEFGEQSRPACLGLLRSDVDGEEPSESVRADAVGDQRRDVLDGARPSGVDERGVEVQVRDGLGDGLATQRLDLVVEPARHAAHRRATDALAEEHLGHAAHVARRHAADVRLGDSVIDLGLTPRVPPQRRGGRPAGACPADPHRDLPGRGNDASVVAAVAHVDPLVAALVGAGADQTLELLVEHDLDGRLDRLPHPGGEVMLEVFLRRQHEVGSLIAKGSCWSLQGGLSSVSQPRDSLFLFGGPKIWRVLHNYRDTTASPISSFIKECCQVGPGLEVNIQRLFERWQHWCKENGRDHTGTRDTFCRDLRSVLPRLRKVQHRVPNGDRPRFYVGLGLP